MKQLKVEWKHLETESKTCLRCSETGKNLEVFIDELKNKLKTKGIEVVFKEKRLPAAEISLSNLILINDRPLERWLPGAQASENECSSCCQLIGNEVYCRTVIYQGETYETIPEELIRQAINIALKKMERS